MHYIGAIVFLCFTMVWLAYIVKGLNFKIALSVMLLPHLAAI